jgi:predicted metal-dependent HD superfamily phosphohydrolase
VKADVATSDGDVFERSWRRAWRALGGSDDGVAVRDALLAAYRAPERAYHTPQHLRECIERFETSSDLAAKPAEVEIALWFHDAVHDVHRRDNERRSADWARAALAAGGAAPEVAARVDALVMATAHLAATTTPGGADADLVVDIDLAILGGDAARFAEYERQIRREYAHVGDAEFRTRRSAVLAAFLARDAIYRTPRLFAELETQARRNLALAIAGDVA